MYILFNYYMVGWETTNLSGYKVFTRYVRAITSQYLNLLCLKNVYSQFTMNYKMEN